MKVKIIIIFLFLFLFSGLRVVFAEVIINEVQISPTDKRFIELYNSGGSDVDLTGWYIQRKTENGNEFTSLVSKTNFENKTINSNGYLVIARSTVDGADIVLSNLTLTDSNTIQIKNADQEVVDSIVLGDTIPNPTENQSVQKTNGGWILANPTPGETNENTAISSENISSGENNNSDTVAEKKKNETKTKIIEAPTIKVKILANNLSFTGQVLKLKASVLGYFNENIVLGKMYWNFGDGKSLEQINNFEEFNHIYYYPGEYALVLEYYQNNFSKTPDAIAKMTIKVLPTTVVISKVGDMKDFFIELTNSASSDIDISSWYIRANGKIFVLPRNSVILSKKQMTIPGIVNGFKFGDQFDLKLFSANNELVFDYNIQNNPVKIDNNIQNKQKQNVNPTIVSEESNKSTLSDSSLSQINQTIEASDLTSSVTLSEDNKKNNSYFFFWIFVVLLLVSGGATYYIRGRNNVSKVGDDFKIIDE